jgi:hypothetical protein
MFGGKEDCGTCNVVLVIKDCLLTCDCLFTCQQRIATESRDNLTRDKLLLLTLTGYRVTLTYITGPLSETSSYLFIL